MYHCCLSDVSLFSFALPLVVPLMTDILQHVCFINFTNLKPIFCVCVCYPVGSGVWSVLAGPSGGGVFYPGGPDRLSGSGLCC